MPVIERPDLAQNRAEKMNASINPSFLASTPDSFGVEDVPIYFYNISPMEFNEPRYPNHPHMLIRACPPGQPYVMARGSITHPFREMREDQNAQKYPVLTDGFKEAAKMLNPMNPGLDQDFHDPSAFNEGGNLNRFGVFWSTHNPPLEEELEAATRRLKRTFQAELEIMVAVEAKEGPDGARNRANSISHAAAEYFGQSYSWHRSDLVPKDVKAGKIDCGVCGEKIMPAARLCIHCGAPTDPELQEAWFAAKLGEPPVPEHRGPGRPRREQ